MDCDSEAGSVLICNGFEESVDGQPGDNHVREHDVAERSTCITLKAVSGDIRTDCHHNAPLDYCDSNVYDW